mmetsp:Transcript_19887/g.32077  ORF Transcript_19887/g.32077 Transcript_19887/m.32077 type:complete len:183 (+) Transcript_19887:122-670(+)
MYEEVVVFTLLPPLRLLPILLPPTAFRLEGITVLGGLLVEVADDGASPCSVIADSCIFSGRGCHGVYAAVTGSTVRLINCSIVAGDAGGSGLCAANGAQVVISGPASRVHGNMGAGLAAYNSPSTITIIGLGCPPLDLSNYNARYHYSDPGPCRLFSLTEEYPNGGYGNVDENNCGEVNFMS